MLKRRSPLEHQGGEPRVAGDAGVSRILAESVIATEGSRERFTHAFHSYPARMHPRLAETLLEHVGAPGDVVLDPFCGSGTVVVEALAAGRRVIGTDLNPLAVRLARVKSERRDADSRDDFVKAAKWIAEESEELVRSRAQMLAPLSPDERAWYEVHTLKELAGIWKLVHDIPVKADLEAFEMVFSAIVTKFSNQRADTAEVEVPKRIRKGLPTEFFLRKAEELAIGWQELERAVGDQPARRRVELEDVRDLPRIIPKDWHADLVLTSPPYGGTYDYADHHRRRMAWLELDSDAFERDEIGARRNVSFAERGLERWDAELRESLAAIVKVTKPGGKVVLWLGDAESRGERLYADDHMRQIAPDVGLMPVAIASQSRPDWRGGEERNEHLMAFKVL